jgi:peptide/nickel transport system substrate-binding protein
LSLDRKAFIDTITQGEGQIGGVLQPSPEGLWGMPPDLLKELPGYDPDVQKNRAEARTIMERLGYGAHNRLQIKVSIRDLPPYRDPAIILIDQLKKVYIDGELETIDTALYYPRILRKDYTVALNLTQGGPDPDPILDALYSCGSELNLSGVARQAVNGGDDNHVACARTAVSFLSCGRSAVVPVIFSRNIFWQPAALSWAVEPVRSCASVETRA